MVGSSFGPKALTTAKEPMTLAGNRGLYEFPLLRFRFYPITSESQADFTALS